MDIGSATNLRKPRLSKNRGKKAWRKFSNVADVEKSMDDQREDERLGGPLYEKADEEIFTVDSTPQKLAQTAEKKPIIPSAVDITDHSSVWKDLKCYKNLSGDRETELRKPHLQKSLASRSTQIKKDIANKTQKKSRKQLQVPEVTTTVPAVSSLSVKTARRDPFFNRDIWATSSTAAKPDSIEQNQTPITAPSRLPPSLRKKVIRGLPPVELPHPGSSYNPSTEDYEKLVATAAAAAARIVAEETKLAVFNKQVKAGNKTAAEVWMSEMEQGLPGLDTRTEEDKLIKEEPDVEELEEVKLSNGGSKDRKTGKVKRRIEAEKAKTKELQLAKEKKIWQNEVFSAKKLLKEIKADAVEKSKKQLARKLKREDPMRIKKLGRLRYEPETIDVKMKDEMEDNLRLLKPEGSILLDRFKSLQKRNILEPRKRQKNKRKYKLKKYQIEGRKMESE
ncbi:hypothetical protein RvY_07749 [Ramazzottius varieornatus]|uniref:Ribosome biogenesis protein NOP53 n=1 Tax=Ramazzottius varieornatus TaxID=947166 RepID=A0A1D1V3K8_RAMVA|nr:hypothetical protein RvY_07749 [Ramazzottius varieornatus]